MSVTVQPAPDISFADQQVVHAKTWAALAVNDSPRASAGAMTITMDKGDFDALDSELRNDLVVTYSDEPPTEAKAVKRPAKTKPAKPKE